MKKISVSNEWMNEGITKIISPLALSIFLAGNEMWIENYSEDAPRQFFSNPDIGVRSLQDPGFAVPFGLLQYSFTSERIKNPGNTKPRTIPAPFCSDNRSKCIQN